MQEKMQKCGDKEFKFDKSNLTESQVLCTLPEKKTGLWKNVSLDKKKPHNVNWVISVWNFIFQLPNCTLFWIHVDLSAMWYFPRLWLRYVLTLAWKIPSTTMTSPKSELFVDTFVQMYHLRSILTPWKPPFLVISTLKVIHCYPSSFRILTTCIAELVATLLDPCGTTIKFSSESFCQIPRLVQVCMARMDQYALYTRAITIFLKSWGPSV